MAYGQAGVHTGTKLAGLLGGDVYIRSYVQGLENPVHTSRVRIVDLHRDSEVAPVQAEVALPWIKYHAGFLGRSKVLNHCVLVDVGGVGRVVVERAVSVVMEQVVFGRGCVWSNMFAEPRVLVAASMVVDDATVVKKQRQAIGRGRASHY